MGSNLFKVEPAPEPKILKVGIVGAGIFAQGCHAKTLLKFPKLCQVTAVWSRSKASADKLVKFIQEQRQDTAGTPLKSFFGADQYEKMLSVVDCITMALPIGAQPPLVKTALNHGVHVFSEKAMAVSVEQADDLLATYEKCKVKDNNLVWLVGENYRVEAGFQALAKACKDCKLKSAKCIGRSKLDPENDRYYKTTWRHDVKEHGGRVMDTGVHYLAGFRLGFGDIDLDSICGSGSASEVGKWGVDNFHIKFKFGDNVDGEFICSNTIDCSQRVTEYSAECNDGTITLARDFSRAGYVLTMPDGTEAYHQFCGIDREFEVFLRRVRGEMVATEPDVLLLSPNQARSDVALCCKIASVCNSI